MGDVLGSFVVRMCCVGGVGLRVECASCMGSRGDQGDVWACEFKGSILGVGIQSGVLKSEGGE